VAIISLEEERRKNLSNTDTKKVELKNQSLKERFAAKVAEYEDEIAEMRADATMMLEALQGRIQELEKELSEKNVEVVPSED